MKRSRVLIITVSAIIIAVAIVVVLMFNRHRRRRMTTEEESTRLLRMWNRPDLTNDDFPLRLGSRGNRVRELQWRMNILLADVPDLFRPVPVHQYGARWGEDLHELVVDGMFGRNTEAVVKGWFGTNGLSAEQGAAIGVR